MCSGMNKTKKIICKTSPVVTDNKNMQFSEMVFSSPKLTTI